MKKILSGFLIGCFILTFCSMAITGDTKFVASRNSTKYHYTWCKWAKKISPYNLVTFSSVREAKSRGYVPCKVCMPPAEDK